MAEIGAGLGTSYPAGIDVNTSLESSSTKARAAVPNDLTAAVIAVEAALGTNPQGTATDLKTRLAAEHNNDGTHPALVHTLASYTTAALPAAGTAGRLARVTDGVGGPWMDGAIQWRPLLPFIDVTQPPFNAVGNYTTTDDTAAIQAALDAVPSTGGTVFLPPLTYKFSTLSIKANTHLLGYGAILRSTTTTSGGLRVLGTIATTKSDVVIEGLTVNMNAVAAIADANASGIRLDYVARVKIINCTVQNTGWQGIYVNAGADRVWILNNVIDYAYGDGIHLGDADTGNGKTLNGVWIKNNFIQNSYDDGIGLTGSMDYIWIIDNIVRTTTIGAGIDVSGASNVRISNNLIQSYGQHGIRIQPNLGFDSYDVLVENNILGSAPSGQYPIALLAPNLSHLTNPIVIRNNKIMTGGNTGIYLNGVSHGLIEDNKIDAAVYGINLDGTAGGPNANISVKNNWIRGATTGINSGAASVNGTVEVIGNLFYSVTTPISVNLNRLSTDQQFRRTDLVAGDIALSAGWGTTATVSAISGTDQRLRFTITSAGTGQGANPTATLTFKDGTWTTAPFAVVSRNGGDQAAVLPTWTTTATTLVLTFPGTPIAAETYTFECVVMG